MGSVRIHHSPSKPSPHCVYVVNDKEDLRTLILPILEHYPFLTVKQNNVIFMKKLLDLNVIHSSELTLERNKLNNTLLPTIKAPYYLQSWVIGFIEGAPAEGSFSVYKARGYFEASFSIGQKNGESILLLIKNALHLTTKVYPDKHNDCFYLKVSSVKNIENVINGISMAPVKFLGHKRLSYGARSASWLEKIRTIPKYCNSFKIPQDY